MNSAGTEGAVNRKYMETRKQTIRRIAGYALAGFLFLTGFLIFSYPLLVSRLTDQTMTEEMESFHSVKETASGQDSREEGSPAEEKRQNGELYEAMREYNQSIAENGQSGLTDAWAYEQSSVDLSEYGLYNAPVGVLRIPKMEVELPIYLGASKNNMSKGAGQLGQTSMPIGGTDTNCVIAAHRGYNGSPFFREIERLKIGDEVFIENLWETLTYRVSKTEVISPDEIDKVLIQAGKDMVTLITCHPYTHNYQRYVVYCERVLDDEKNKDGIEEDNVKENNALEAAEETEYSSSEMMIGADRATYILIPVLLAALELWLLRREKKERRKQAGNR